MGHGDVVAVRATPIRDDRVVYFARQSGGELQRHLLAARAPGRFVSAPAHAEEMLQARRAQAAAAAC